VPSKNADSSLWKPIAFGLFVVIIGILAYAMGRSSSPAPAPAVTPEAAPPADREPADTILTAGPTPSGVDFTVPATSPAFPAIEGNGRAAVEQPAPTPAPAEASPTESAPVSFDERPREDRESCLTLEATPNRVEVYGASGPAVQLIVRARNRCAIAFSGRVTYFRAYATAPGGFDLATAAGRFDGTIPAWGSAETLIALECDPTRVARYRVEIRR